MSATWLLLMALAPGLANSDELASERTVAATRSIRVLRDSRLPDSAPTDVVVQTLRGEIAVAHSELIDLLVAGRVPALEEEEEAQTLSVPQRDMVLEALASLPSGTLLTQAERLLVTEDQEVPEIAARAVASRLLAMGGGSESMRLIFSILAPLPGASANGRCMDALEWSIETVLAADRGSAHIALRLELFNIPKSLMASVLRALGDDGDPSGLEIVLVIAERFPGARIQAFAQARRLGASGDPDLDQWFGALLRRFLDPGKPNLARSAALCLGELADSECVGDLIDLLEGSSAQSEANWALCRISGLRLGPSQERWRQWYDDEIAFFRDSYEDCLGDLHGPDRGRAVYAIRELSRHRLHRHRVANELVLALDDAEPSQRRLLCNALEAMGSRPSAPALVRFLDDPDPVLVAAALRALRTLTELNLPADSGAWALALNAQPGPGHSG